MLLQFLYFIQRLIFFQLFLHSFKISCVTVGYCMEQCLLTLIVFLLIDSLFVTSLMVNFNPFCLNSSIAASIIFLSPFPHGNQIFISDFHLSLNLSYKKNLRQSENEKIVITHQFHRI